MPATKTDLTINGKNALGKSASNKISYVNPTISTTQAILLSQKFNALTTNTYESTTRTDQTILDATTPLVLTQIRVISSTYVDVTTGLSSDNLTIQFPISKVADNKQLEFEFWSSQFNNVTKQLLVTPADTSQAVVLQTMWNTPDYFNVGLRNVLAVKLLLAEKATQTFTATFHFQDESNFCGRDLTINLAVYDDSEG